MHPDLAGGTGRTAYTSPSQHFASESALAQVEKATCQWVGRLSHGVNLTGRQACIRPQSLSPGKAPMQCLEKGQGRTPVEAEERVGDLKAEVSAKVDGRSGPLRAPSAA